MMCRIEDHALIGHCRAAALVGRDGSIDLLDSTRFDSQACFAALLGTAENGRWLIALKAALVRINRRYWLNTFLETIRGAARVALIFALPLVICWIPGFGFASGVLEQKFDGIVVPRLWVQVTPQIHGVISRIVFAPGQRVSKGDPLFEIEPDDFAINVRIAQAELEESRAHLSMAEDAAGRQRVLLRENSTAQQTARQSEIDVAIARAINARNEAALDKAQLALSRTHVLAAISGIVGRSHVAPGALVEPTTGTILAEIVQLDPILVSFDVPYNERQRALDQAGTTNTEKLFQRITLSLELPSGRIYERSSKPEYLGSQIDESTGMLTIWAEFSNPDRVLLPGLKVHVISRLGD